MAFQQTEKGIELALAAVRRDPIFTVFALTLDVPAADGKL